MRARTLGLTLLVKNLSLSLTVFLFRKINAHNWPKSIALARASHNVSGVVVRDVGIRETPCGTCRSLIGRQLAKLEYWSSL